MKKTIFITLLALLSVFSAQAYDFEVDGIYYYQRNGLRHTGEVMVTYKEYIDGEGYTSDYSGSVVIPATVTYNGYTSPVTGIDDHAFDGCSGLTSVTIPESVTFIGKAAFYGTSINSPLYDGRGFFYMPPSYSGEYEIPSGIQWIADHAFDGCSGLTSVTIPESVASIGASAFEGCSGLTSVKWNAVSCNHYSYVSTDYASGKIEGVYPPFYNCENITSFTIGNQVEHIPAYLCYKLKGLTSVTIPESVTNIGFEAFLECTDLASVEWNAVDCQHFRYGTDYSGYSDYYYRPPFYNCNITSITFGEHVKCIPAYLCEKMNKLTSVTIPESVTGIGSSAFYNCSGLTSVEWNAVACEYFQSNYGGKPPFYNCNNITSFTFGNQVEHIPACLCYEMDELSSVTLPESVTSIGDWAFEGCSGLTSVTIPENVTSIGDGAFQYCEGLTSVTIPENVTSIGDGAFDRCSLTKVTSLAKRPPLCTNNTFGEESYYTISLYVPSGSKLLYTVTDGWRKFAKIEEFDVTSYTVRVQPNDAAMGLVIGGGEYKDGEQAMLAAIPNKGYYFEKWDDGSTANPRILTVTSDTTITAIFVKDDPTANENAGADNFRVYVQDRTIHLSEERGAVQVYNVAGQCVYNGHSTAIPVSRSGMYIVAVNGQRLKVAVR